MPLYEIETPNGIMEVDHDGDLNDLLPALAAFKFPSRGMGDVKSAEARDETRRANEVQTGMGDARLAETNIREAAGGQLARLAPAAIAETTADAIIGMADLANTPITPLGAMGAVQKLLRGENPQETLLKHTMAEIREDAAGAYGVEEATRKTTGGKIVQGAASLVPAIAAGPAAPAVMAGMMGESLRAEAEAAGATPEQQEIARISGAGIGILSEALMGMPALLRSAKAAGVPDATFKTIARAVAVQVGKGSAREGTQEGMEQTAQNLVASTIAGYDRKRKTFEDVPESVFLGSLLGGPLGGGVQALASIDARSASLPPPLPLTRKTETGVPEMTSVNIPSALEVHAPLTAAAVRETTEATTEGGEQPNATRTISVNDQGALLWSDPNRGEQAGPDVRLDGGGQGQQAPGDNSSGDLQARGQGAPGPSVYPNEGNLTSTPEPAPLAETSPVAADQQPATSIQSAAGAVPAISPEVRPRPNEAGGFSTTRGTLVPTLGSTPSGSTPIRIPSAAKRIGRGLFTEGSADVLARQENPVAQELSTAIKEHVDQEQVLFAEATMPMERALKGMSSRQQESAFKEAEAYYRAKENGRAAPKLSAATQKVVTAWEDIAELTGKNVQDAGTLLFDAKLGGYRPPKLIGRGYLPRRFSKEVERVFRDPKKDPALWNNLVRSLATHKGISEDAAASELQATAARFSDNDFFGNIEMARGEQLPEIFYDYDLRNLISTYIPRYAERLAQIKAYGQRLVGAGGVAVQENLFDKAKKEAQDQYSKRYLNEIEQQATNFRVVNSASDFARRAQTLANTVLLSSPTTTVLRNMLSGTGATAEMFGVDRAARAMVDAVKPQSFSDAREMGVIRSNMGDLLNADQLGDTPMDDALRSFQNFALKWSGYNGSELFVRTHAAMAGSQYTLDAVQAIIADPNSNFSKEAKALFKRMGVDETAILSEAGDWKNGQETRKFIRAVIRDSQGGYRFDQVPLWANSAAGRFFYQYGRYGVQRGRNLFKNAVIPAIKGTEIVVNGKKQVRRDFLPLTRMLIAAGLMGEVFALLAKGLFDRDRRDASLTEIGVAWGEDKSRAAGMAMERLLNDIITGGTLGIVSQPLDWARSLKDQTRLKDPFTPPGTAPIKAATTLVQNLLDQGTVTQRDLESFVSSLTPGPEQVADVAKNLTGNERYRAQQDLTTLRNAALRWAKQKGLDVAPRVRDKTAMRKSAKAPAYEPIKDALLMGDAAEAQKLAREYIQSLPEKEREQAARSIAASVENSQPFRSGPYRGNDKLAQFDAWAKKNLPSGQYERSARVQNNYVTAAKAAGLMD